MENDYVNGQTTIGKYVSFSQFENIEKIDAYLNSKHISGDTDAKGREKPFFNIVTAAVNIWYRATDIDRKNIRIKATKMSQYVLAFLATIKLQDWMKKSSFGMFLNEWGRALARYGSSVVKFVEKDGDLYCEVIPWNRFICDTVDFDNNIKIEKLWMTPAQLRKNKSYNQDVVKNLLQSLNTRETIDRQKKDTKNDYIPVYEVHGELPLSFLTGEDKDQDTYVNQMHVVSFVAQRKNGKTEFEDYTLISGQEAKCPYMITHLIKEDGRTQAIGAVEYLFDAQWMMNHTTKQIKDQLDLASKLIFQTSDTNFVGQNALKAIENGDILIHKANQPLTELANTSHDITALQNFGMQWYNMSKELTSTPDAIRGNTMPSGTAYRQVAVLNQESNSLFELMTENKGLYIEDMLRNYVIPHFKKKLNTADEISAILEDNQITQLDSMYVPNEALRRINNKVKATILTKSPDELTDEEMMTPDVYQQQTMQEEQNIQKELSTFGNQRFVKPSEIDNETWKEVFKDLEWEVDVEVTNENSNREVVMTTLNTVLQTIAGNPAILEDPRMKMLLNRILNETGVVSGIELSQFKSAMPMAQPAAAMPQVGGEPTNKQF
jgi:hypothetical protein